MADCWGRRCAELIGIMIGVVPLSCGVAAGVLHRICYAEAGMRPLRYWYRRWAKVVVWASEYQCGAKVPHWGSALDTGCEWRMMRHINRASFVRRVRHRCVLRVALIK
jgi:hypothetical protein